MLTNIQVLCNNTEVLIIVWDFEWQVNAQNRAVFHTQCFVCSIGARHPATQNPGAALPDNQQPEPVWENSGKSGSSVQIPRWVGHCHYWTMNVWYRRGNRKAICNHITWWQWVFIHTNGVLCVVDHPITYLYNTLHYYHKILVQRAAYKRRLVTTIWSKGLLAIVRFYLGPFVLLLWDFVSFCPLSL